MGRLEGWLGAAGGYTTLPCMAGSGYKCSESHYLSGSGEERGQGMGTGYVWVWRGGESGSTPQMVPSPAVLHFHVCVMGL